MSGDPRPGAPRLTLDDLGAVAGAAGSADAPEAFLQAWFQLFKTAQLHALDNQAMERPMTRFAELVERLVEREGSIHLFVKDRALHFGGIKMKLSTEEQELAQDVFELFDERGMGGFAIDGELDVAAIRRLLEIVIYAPPAERKFAHLETALRAAELPFRIQRPIAGESAGAARAEERRNHSFEIYAKLVVVLRSLLAATNPSPTRRVYLVRKLSRLIESVVDLVCEDDHAARSAAATRSNADYPAQHGVNTAIHSIVVGRRLGLSKIELADLGMAALFHDLGVRTIAGDRLSAEGPLQPEDRRQLDRRTFRAVEALLEERNLSRSLLTRIIVAFEQTLPLTGSKLGRPGLDSRIVAIASAFDAMTSDRPWRRAMPPERAFDALFAAAGTKYDPALLEVFLVAVGVYPIGTIVRLSDGDNAIVVDSGGSPARLARPVVAILDAAGRPERRLDLLEPGAGPAPTISGSVAASELGLRASGTLLLAPAE